MGNKQSTSTTVSQLVDVINNNTTNILMKTQDSASSACITNQSQSLILNNINNCNLNSIQNATSNCSLSTYFIQNLSANLASIISTSIDQAAAASSQAIQDTLSMPMNSQSTSTSITVAAHIKNLLTTNFTTDTQNSCIATATANQKGQLTINGCVNSNIDLSQYAQINNIASCVANTISSILTNDQALTQTVQSSQASTTASQQGLGTVLNNAIAAAQSAVNNAIGALTQLGLGALTATVLVYFGIILFFGLIGFFIYKILLSPSGQYAIKKGTDTGSDIVEKKYGGGGSIPAIKK